MGASLCRLCAHCFGGKAGSDGDARNIFHGACWPLSPGRSWSLHWAAGLSAQWICSEVAGAEALGHALAGLFLLTVCLPSSCCRAFAPKEGSAEESGARVPTEVCLCRHLWLCSGIAQACIFPLLRWYQI